MNLTTILIFLVPAVLMLVVALQWRRILASRPVRVGLAILALPVILFCGFGFLATFEGSDLGFLVFRWGYGVLGIVLSAMAVFLVVGRLRVQESGSTR